MSKILLFFDHGILTKIEVEPQRGEEILTLEAAFRQKYGPSTDSLTWEGNDTVIRFNNPDHQFAEFQRKSVTEVVGALSKQEEDKRTKENERRVDEVKKKLDADR